MADDASPPWSPKAGSPRPPLPDGTVTLSVERLVANSHQRGGRREPVGQVVPGELDALLAAQSPGRYRVSCLDAGTRFIRGGVYVVEISPDTESPRIVPARTSRDYPAEPSPLLRARRKEREAVGRVDTLRRKLRRVERENVRLRHDTAVSEAEHLAERLRDGKDRRRLRDEVERLSHQMSELRAEVERRDRELRASIDAALTQQEARVEQRLVALVGWVRESFTSGTSDQSDEQVAGVEDTTADLNDADSLPPGSGRVGEPPFTQPGTAGGMAALASVRDVPRDRRLRAEGTEQPTDRAGTLEQLGRFLRQEPPKR